MEISICVPFEGAGRMAPVWAEAEREVDFVSDPEGAAKTTISFMAMELKRHLEKAYAGLRCRVCETCDDGGFISLEIADYGSRDGSFSITPVTRAGCRGAAVRGGGRAGLVYGAYEFLRMQGYDWYYPGKNGEVFSGTGEGPVFPGETIIKKPSMELSRAFDMEYVSMESDEFYLWMARNRMNVTVWRPNSGPLCEKLGMVFKAGGHIFEKILDPDRPMPSGKTLWEEHEDWFGLPPGGARAKERAQSVQFCVSNKDLTDFLGNELIDELNGAYGRADRLEIWGYDTWGAVCTCGQCAKLGNGSDAAVKLVSDLKVKIDEAYAEGLLNRPVMMSMCSYEGTATLAAPENPFPENVSAGVINAYYPIDRCYAHQMGVEFDAHQMGDSQGCARNARFDDNLRKWLAAPGAPKLVMGEYYNVSKYEDLPLVLKGCIARDIPYYRSLGVAGMTYMHVPMVNWGVRSLTQCLYAGLAYDAEMDVPAFLERYFTGMYGPAADLMKSYYDECEECAKYIASWRAWNDSVLSQLLRWDGGAPESPLEADAHFAGIGEFLSVSEGLLERLVKAYGLLSGALEACMGRRVPGTFTRAVNPAQEALAKNGDRTLFNVNEAIRGHIYLEDTFALMLAVAIYHNALYEGEDAEPAWERADGLARKTETYYVPVSYEFPGAGLESRSAGARTQLDGVVARIRANRRVKRRGLSQCNGT